MNCSSCGHENPAGSSFCLECGSPYTSRCVRCNGELPAAAKFCNNCGSAQGSATSPAAPDPRRYTPKHLADKILTSRSAIEGERKQVTILFADVKGSMDLGEQVDPEQWYRIMHRFFQILSDGIHRFEGMVDKFTGDGIMAIFGAPIAHEDHARRACFAALHLKEELRRYADELRLRRGLNFAVRMGLNSGEVVVGTIGDDLKMVYTAHGNTVGLANRMEQIAASDRAYLTERTAKLVSGFFRLRDLGLVEVKGASEPVGVYELEGVGSLHTPLEVSRTRGFTRFVGRMDEMAALEAALAGALEGNGQVIGVVADPGLGKSRVCHEFAERCRARGLPVYQAHCVSHGKAVPFLPLLEYLRAYFAIGDRDRDQTVREKVAGRVLLLDPELGPSLPLLFDLLGVPDPERPVPRIDPDARQRQLFAVMTRLTNAQSRREPGVSLIEDLHWIDAGSEAFLENFVEAIPGSRGLLLLNFRPEYRGRWMAAPYYQEISLMPLRPEVATELLADLLGSDRTIADLGARIFERTGGNPFFIEEVVRSLAERGILEGTRSAYRLSRPVSEVAIPPTVQAVIAARIDRLGERDKQVLGSAAVIGRRFSERVLERVADLPPTDLAEALRALVGSEFLYEEALHPDAEYAFCHPLTHEVAYGSQLSERRARVHANVARAIQEVYPERLSEQAAVLAQHWENAGEALEAARWHRRAAEWTGAANAAEALRHWKKVRALVATLPDSPKAVGLGVLACSRALSLAWRVGGSEEETRAIFAEGRELAKRQPDRRALAILVSSYAAVLGVVFGDVKGWIRHGREAFAAAADTGDRRILLTAGFGLQEALSVRGDFREALEVADRLLGGEPPDPDLGADVLGHSPSLSCRANRALIVGMMGNLREATSELERLLPLTRERGELELQSYMHSLRAALCIAGGDARSALFHAREELQIDERAGLHNSEVFGYWNLGGAYLLSGEWDEAALALERGLAILHQHRSGVHVEERLLARLAEAYSGRGEVERARRSAEQAIALAEGRGAAFHAAFAHLALARILLRADAAGCRAAIEESLDRAAALGEETGARIFAPAILEERSRLSLASGDRQVFQRLLGEAHSLFAEMGATAHAERLAKELPP